MNRLDYYFRQLLSESELDQGFAYAESADQLQTVDAGLIGIHQGLEVAQTLVPSMSVGVSTGVAYDALGQRIPVDVAATKVCSQDYLGVTTAVVTPGNEKYISIFIEAARTLTDPRTDGNSLTVYFNRAESYTLRVVQGVEAGPGAATPPVLDPDRVLLADVLMYQGMTSIVNADIDTSRTQHAFQLTGAPVAISVGTAEEALQSLLTTVNGILGGSGGVPAAGVSYNGGAAWADGTTNPAATAEAQFDKIIGDIGNTTNGSARIGAGAIAGAPVSLGAGTLASQIGSLLSAVNARGILASANSWSAKNTFSGATWNTALTEYTHGPTPGGETLRLKDLTIHTSSNAALNRGNFREYDSHLFHMLTHNAEGTTESSATGTTQADNTSYPAMRVRWDAARGVRICRKSSTAAPWGDGGWDVNGASVCMGHQYAAYAPSAIQPMTITDSNWHPCTLAGADVTLEFDSVSLGAGWVLEASFRANYVLFAGVSTDYSIDIRLEYSTDAGGTWEPLDGSNVYMDTTLLNANRKALCFQTKGVHTLGGSGEAGMLVRVAYNKPFADNVSFLGDCYFEAKVYSRGT